MAFRIHRGIWQFQKPDGAYESKYKLNDSGQLVETDTEGNETGGMTASVSWTSISGRPTALSGFTNDLGNYGGWLSTSGKAADSETVDGVDSSRIVYGSNERRSTRYDQAGIVSPNQNSGFYYGYNPDGAPFDEWWNWLTVAGASWTSGNNYDFKLAHNFHNDDFYVSRMTNGTQYSWRRIIDSGNIGSQSVNYASTAGNSSTTSQTSFSSLSTGGGLRDSLNRRFVVPGGGSYATSTSVITGAIRIKLPTQGSGMMMTCTAKVYEYSLSKSFTITFGGHRDGNNWYNQFCYIDGDTNRGNLTVRFGVSGGRDCVWIGETNSSWSYPQVFITDIQIGYTAIDSRWASDWIIDFVTSFDTINRTSTAYAKITNANIGDQSVNYAATSGTSSATTQTDFSELSVGGEGVATREYVTSQGYLTSLPSHNHDGSYLPIGGKAADSELLDGLDSSRFLYTTSGTFSGDWNTLTDSDLEIRLVEVHNITGGAHSNHPTGLYTYGSVLGWQLSNSTFKLYNSHTGDLAFQTGWNNDGHSGWRTIIHSANIGSQSVNYAASAGNADTVDGWHRDDLRAWGNLTGVPSTFSPSAHTHDDRYYTESEVDSLLAGKQAAGSYAASNHNHTYNVNDNWLRENGDNANFQIYGNTRQVAFRTDGTTEYASGVGGYAFAWMYGGDAASNRRMLLASDGRLWSSYHGWMDDAFQPRGSYAATSHTHAISDVTGLQTALDGKQAAGTYLTSLPSHNHDDRYFTETESDSRFLKLAGGTLTGQLNLHAGSYEGSIVFGSQATWRTGIRQHDDGDAELRIWAKHASGMIFIATGYDGEPASISRPTDGLAIQGNNLGIGNFSTSDPSYKLHVKGDIYANGGWVRVSGSEGLYFESYAGGWRMTDSTWIRAYNDKNIYTGGSIEAGGSVRADSGILDSNRRFVIPGGASTVNHPSGTGGAIRINLPTAAYGINTMMSMTVQVYEYSTGQSFTIRCGGYNYYTHSWYNVFAYLLNDSGKGSDVPVYFGHDGTRDVIWIGEPGWAWSYPNVFVTDFQAGHTQSEYWKTGWSISFDTAARTNVTASRTAYRQIDTGTIGSQSVSSATTATTLATARTLTIGNTDKTFNGSANVSWTLAEIGAQAAGSYAAASHTHDDRYYTESESDTRFATAAQGAKADSALQSLPDHTHDDRYYTESESLSLFARKDTNSAIGGNLVIGNGTYGNSTAYGNSGARLMFSGSNSDAQGNYYIGTNHEDYGGNYSKLDLRWHTGIRMGAQAGYGGIRFYDNEDFGSRIMSIGESDTNVRIDNNLWIGGAGGWITDLLAGKQASGSYAAASHTHTIANVTGLQAALDDKQAAGSYAASSHTHDYVPLAGGTMSGTLTLKNISGVSQTVPNSYGAYLHLGDWGVGRTAAGAVLVNTAYRADYATSLFDMNISRFTNDSGYITAYGAQGANGNFYIDDNYGYGIVGLYSATRYQGVFAMGDAYKLSADGTSAGSLYGIAWTHSNIGGESKSGLGHQALFMMNGRTYTAIGSGIWTDGTITTTSHGNSSQWNTAYGWGSHASAGYQAASSAITTSNIGSQSVAYADRARGSSGYPHAGYGMMSFYNWGGSNGGASEPNDGSYTVGISVGSHPSDQAYGFQIGRNMWNDGLWTRGYDSGWREWIRLIDSTNIGSQSVSYADTAGSAPANGGNSSTVGGLAVHGGRNNEANKVVRTDGNGYIQAGWINTTSGNNGTTAIARIYASEDGYIRYYTPANFISVLGLITTGNIGSQSVNYAASAGAVAWDSVSGKPSTFAPSSHTHSASEVGLGNVSNAAQVTTSYNSSLNSDSRNSRGVTRLYRRDDNSDYSVQAHWTGSHWWLRGYGGDSFHAEARVGYADSAGNASTASSADSAESAINLNGSNVVTSGNNLYIQNGGVNNYRIHHTGDIGVFDVTSRFSIREMSSIWSATRYQWGNYMSHAWFDVDPWGDNWGIGGNPTDWKTVNRGSFLTFGFEDWSDRRHKSAIVEIDNAVDKVKAISGYTYWKRGSKVREAGVIAQDVLAVLPEAVGGTEEGYSVKPAALIGLLMKAVKEQQETIDALTARIEALENK